MKIAVLGYGKMGKTIERLALEGGHDIVLKTNQLNTSFDLTNADVAIDFSSAEIAPSNILACFEQNTPVVSGTTGWLSEYNNIIQKCEASNGSFLYASNFSIGVNIFFNLNEHLAKLMEPLTAYSVEIEETHHTEKKDTPSGTAITLADTIIENSDYENWNLIAPTANEIKIDAKRISEVKGTHEIKYASAIDTITIKHEAHSRDGFALGALLAANWLQYKKGIFSMKDVLNIR